MALPVAKIQQMPDLACLGQIKDVGPAKEPGEGKFYYTITLTLEAAYGGRDNNNIICFRPEWFDKSFTSASLEKLAAEDQQAGKQYGPYWMYCRTVAHQNGKATLQTLTEADGSFTQLLEAFDAVPGKMDGATVGAILRDHLLGKEVGYILRQRMDKGENGEKILTEQYQVASFFPPTAEGIAQVEKSQTSARRKTPLKVTWNEDN